MTAAAGQTVMRRKAGAGRRAPAAPPMTPEKALGQALARAAQELLALPLRVVSVTEARMTLADLPEALEDRALLALLDGPAAGLGLMVLSPPVLSALLEMRMMGRLAASAPAARRPTRTDAAMAADVIDAGLAGFEAALAGDAALIWAGGFRYGSFLEDPRPLPLILEDTGYRVFRLALELGSGSAAREGGVLLALPAEGRGQLGAPAEDAAAAPAPGEAPQPAGWPDRLEQALMAAPAQLEAVLARLTLPIGEILALQPGATLPLPEGALEQLRIEGPGGRLLARARLGQHRGFRAVRLLEEGEEGQPAGQGPGGQAFGGQSHDGPAFAGQAPGAAMADWGTSAPSWDDPAEADAMAMAPMGLGGLGLEEEAGELPALRIGGM